LPLVDVYLVRHGVAEDAPPRGGDAERRLTTEGRREFARSVVGLRRLDVALTRILTSPLVRARQTAEILQEQLPGPSPEEWLLLAPGGSPDRLLASLRGAEGDAVALVGHEPCLGRLLSLAICGRPGEGTPLRKGGVARIEFDEAPKPGGGRLVWMMTPKLLRRLGRAG
jgi:phosphohistidine phosphatase